MKVAFFSSKPYDSESFNQVNQDFNHQIEFFEVHLNNQTAPLAHDYPAVCAFVNDSIDSETLEVLAAGKTRVIALRCAGFNNVDLEKAKELDVKIVRVPAYSPYAVAEHAVALILSLNRKIYRAHNRVRDGNFSLDGLLGFDLHGRTIGLVGTGKIGSVFAKIMLGFGCKVIAFDHYQNPDCVDQGVKYLTLEEVFKESDIISLHCPLNKETHHLINEKTISSMKDGVMIINTSRGALVDTRSLIEGLKSKKIGFVGLDVYEEEGDLFFEDLSNEVSQDDVFARLTTFPNVLVTGHQAFFTREALENIAQTTLQNLSDIQSGKACSNLVSF